MKIPSFLIPSVAVAALTFTACGGGGDNDSAETVPADVDLEVAAGPGIRFGETEYTATAGPTTVALVNHDSQTHSLDFVAGDGTKLPGELRVGKSGDIDTRDFEFEAGTYQMLCLIPGHEGMKATLTVS